MSDPGRKAIRVLYVFLAASVFGTCLPAEDNSSGKREETYFTFTKTGSLISRPPEMRKPGPYYTCLVDMKGVKQFPFRYALLFSTDHGNRGGIWMYVCNGVPTVADNWKSYTKAVADGDFNYLKKKPEANPIFIDNTQGKQTETPYANVIDGKVYMTYHNCGAGHSQSTLLAVSEDGVNFTRVNGKKDSVIIDYDPRKWPGNGHTGYFRWGPNPFSGVRYRYVGYSLHGGGGRSHSAMWGSDDIITWDKIEVMDHIEGHAIENGKFIKWLEIDPKSITSCGNGEYVAICVGGTRSSGNRPRINELFEIFLASDGRTLTRKGRKILKKGNPGTDDEEEVSQPTTIIIKDTWHLIYVGTAQKARRNTVMGAVGKLNRKAGPSVPLKKADRTRHFLRK